MPEDSPQSLVIDPAPSVVPGDGQQPKCPTSPSLSASPHLSIKSQPPDISASPLHLVRLINTQLSVCGQQPRSPASPSHLTSPTSSRPSIYTPQTAGSPTGISDPASPIITQPSTVPLDLNFTYARTHKATAHKIHGNAPE